MNTPKPKPPTAARSVMVNGRYTTSSVTAPKADPKAMARVMRSEPKKRKHGKGK
jgi:hypothetical protein